jgi:hypothetical protein
MLYVKRRIHNSCKKSYSHTPLTKKLYIDTHYNIKTCLPFYNYMSVGQIDYQNVPPCKHINTMTINRNLE